MSKNFDLIFNSNFDKIDDEKAELLYNQLLEYTPDTESDIDKLKKAYNGAKCVMQIKALQVNVAMEELEEFVKKSKLISEISELKASLKSDNDLDSTHYLSQIEELNNNLDAKSSELIKTKKRNQDLEKKIDLDEKLIQELKEEIEGLKNEQMTEIQEAIDDEMIMVKLREKNKQIQELLDELKEMNYINVELAKQTKFLKNELQMATSELKLAGDEIEKVRNELNQVQEMNQTTIKEKKYLLSEIESLRSNLEKYENQDDVVAVKLNEKIDKLLSMMEIKDEENDKLRLQLKQKTEMLEISDGNELIKKIQVKDKKIEYLKNQLNQAVSDMENQNQIIEKLMKGKNKLQVDDEDHMSSFQEKFKHFKARNDELENELKIKDDQLIEIIKIINQYDKGEYGLSKAILDIKKLRKEIILKDKKIEDLIQELNQTNIKLNDYKDEVDYLMESGTITEEEKQSWKSKNSEEKKNQFKVLQLQKAIVKLEDDKITLQNELRKFQTLNQDNSKMKLSKDDDKLIAHLEALEKENQQLQLGMKEILNGLRESDAQSDVVLDCPSLERLVGLLECRSISGQLTNVIALKAELDLLRGHNQYIRTELKRLRHEHLKLITDYTQVILNKNNHYHQHSLENQNLNEKKKDENVINQNQSEDFDKSEKIAKEHEEEYQKNNQGNYQESDGKDDHKVEQKNDEKNNQESDKKDEEKVGKENYLDKEQEEKPKTVHIANNQMYDEQVLQSNKLEERNEKKDIDIKIENEFQAEDIQKENMIGVTEESGEHEFFGKSTIQEMEKKTQEKNLIQSQKKIYYSLEKEVQTIIDLIHFEVSSKTQILTSSTQTDDEKAKDQCQKCFKLMNYFSEIKEKLVLLEENLKNGEDCYFEHIKILEIENNRLENELKNHLKNNREIVLRKDEMIDQLRKEINQDLKIEKKEDSMTMVESSELEVKNWSNKNERDKGIFTVLQTIIDCLQTRIEHKDEAIKEYQSLMKGMQENFESQIRKLIENQDKKDPIEIKSLDIEKIFDSEELKNALKKCFNELERYKVEYKGKINKLNEEIEEGKLKLNEIRKENEKLKLQTNLPQLPILKKKIESLTKLVQEKDNVIEKLNKNLKYEKMIRSVRPSKKSSNHLIETEQKQSAEATKQVDEMKEKLKQMSEMIKAYDLEKWESNRKYKDTLSGLKEKLKDKEEYIQRLEENLAKVKKLLEKYERNKSPIKWKKVKHPSLVDNYCQTEEKSLPILEQKDIDEVDNQIILMKKELEKLRDTRDELKILLSESIKREKMMKLNETTVSFDKKRDKLLEENAVLKVELRMAEYELRQQKRH